MVQWPWVDTLSFLECPPYLLQVFWWPQTYQSAKTLIQLWNRRGKIHFNYLCFRWYSDPEWTRFLFWSVFHNFCRCLGDLIHAAMPKPWSSYGIEGATIYLNYLCFRWYSDPEWTCFLFWSIIHIFFRRLGDLKHTRVPKPWSSYGIKWAKYIWIIYISNMWPSTTKLSVKLQFSNFRFLSKST